MKYVSTFVAAAVLSVNFAAVKAEASPLSDCYDDAIAACGYLWPGQDSGDAGYSSCVGSGMDLCDGANSGTGGRLKGFKTLAPKKPLEFRKD